MITNLMEQDSFFMKLEVAQLADILPSIKPH
jgi:hypothetical protein